MLFRSSAQLVWGWANELLHGREGGRACCFRVEARENEANAGLYAAFPEWFAPAEGIPELWDAP